MFLGFWFMVYGLEFGVWSLVFGVWGLVFGVWGVGLLRAARVIEEDQGFD